MRISIPALLAAASVIVAGCDSKNVPATVEWQGHAFQEVRALADLPAIIQSELGADRPGTGGVADRGRPFNVTDVVKGNLPMRRLLAAGRNDDTWLVAVERGGRGYSVEVFLFSAAERTPKQKWVLLDRPKSLGEVVRQMPHEGRRGG